MSLQRDSTLKTLLFYKLINLFVFLYVVTSYFFFNIIDKKFTINVLLN